MGFLRVLAVMVVCICSAVIGLGLQTVLSPWTGIVAAIVASVGGSILVLQGIQSESERPDDEPKPPLKS